MDAPEIVLGTVALALSWISILISWATSRRQNTLTEKQVALTERQIKVEEAALMFQGGLAFKDACQRLIQSLQAQKRNAIAMKVGRILFKWERDKGADLSRVGEVKQEILDATGIDFDYFIDTGKARRARVTSERKLQSQSSTGAKDS